MCEKSSDSSDARVSSEESEIIAGYASIEQFTKNGFKTLMEAIKSSSALPSGRDWNFYNTSDSFKKIVNNEGTNVLRLMNQVMRNHEVAGNIRNRVLDEKLELVIEANDVILERVANNLDELNGLRTVAPPPVELQTVSAHLPVNGSWNRPNVATFAVNSKVGQSGGKNNCIKLLTAKNIVRPQKFFKDKVDNRNKVPWYPRITEKPNSLKPLAIFLEECDDRQEYSHPYEFELDRFTPIPEQLLEEKPQAPKPLKDTPLIEVNKPEQLDELVKTLRTCKEFAVDVEHHSYRSFMGFTCLLQISTQDEDYLIDTLSLRDKLHVLNEVFTKNTIVKIFHGADRDVEWLQRDLSLYVVNMFDTHQAAKALQYQSLSLAFLMKKFCNVLPNKEFQLADWRIRPLPDNLKQYAREDTHYLIYIYQMLKKELLLKNNMSDNLLKSVIERSTEICKKRYFKPMLNEDSHLDIYRKCKKMFDNRQMYALKEIFFWRDSLAREEDESLGYVLPNHMLLQISEAVPREMQGILACCNPIPPLVRSNLLSLHQIILKAREQPLEKAIMKDTTGRGVLKKVSKVNVDSALFCPHDLAKTNEFRDDLPTLLQNKQIETQIKSICVTELPIEKSSSYSVFNGSSKTNHAFNERETFKKLHGFAYFSPYERYKLVKPFAVEEDKQAEALNVDTERPEEVSNSVPENTTQDRTDEERIASIKDHFVQLSRKFSEELQTQKEQEEVEDQQRQNARSLLEMGGTRKRKRDDENEGVLSTRPPFNNNLHCPIPNVNYNALNFYGRRNKGKKRKSGELTGEGQGEQAREGAPNKKKKKKQQRQLQQQQRMQYADDQDQQQHQQFQDRQGQNLPQVQGNNRKAQRNMQRAQRNQQQRIQQQYADDQQPHAQQQHQQSDHQDQQRQDLPQGQPKMRRAQRSIQRAQSHQRQRMQQQQFADDQHPNGQHQQAQPPQQHQQPKKKKPNKTQRGGFQRFQGAQNAQRPNNNKNNAGRNNDDGNFAAYDYSSVDFRQFQGGAGSANSGVQIKQNFKPKNRKNKKRGAKSATFGNTMPNRNRGGHNRSY